ncbi:MAG TPA: FtsX-like permease family protein, partial [Mycobacterium sp.]|nr:FtsX-like permease family protein [Mycobacterium sp.]
MGRLGLRLSLRGGREALVRLLLTSLAVAIGVTILLGVFADYHAFQVTSRRPAWEKTQPAAGDAPVAKEALWNYSENIYRGRFIEQLDVAALGASAPVVPGIPRLPERGQYYASPALSALLRSVPADELGGRFPGAQIGVIGDKALSGPDELVIVVGYSPAALAALPNTIRVDTIATSPDLQGTTNIYRLAFGLGAIALLFPLLILINTATRLAAARREERYAALRLVGATPRQVSVIATVDAVAGATIGALAGAGLFVVLRPALAGVSFSGVRFFPSDVTPTLWGYAVMLIGVPVAAAVASLLSLRRVQILPLGVSRKVTPKPPTVARVVPLLLGIPLFVIPVLRDAQRPSRGPVFIGLLLIMVGLVTGGSWLTMQAARLLPNISRGPSS